MELTGDRDPITPEKVGDKGMFPGWDIPKALLLEDVCNDFNIISRLAMLWTVFHQGPGGSCFDFN